MCFSTFYYLKHFFSHLPLRYHRRNRILIDSQGLLVNPVFQDVSWTFQEYEISFLIIYRRFSSLLHISSLILVAVQAHDCEQVYVQEEYDLKDFPSISLDQANEHVQSVINGQLNTGCIKSTDKPAFDLCVRSHDEAANTILCGFRLWRVLKDCDLASQIDNAFYVHNKDGSFSTPWMSKDYQRTGNVHCKSQWGGSARVGIKCFRGKWSCKLHPCLLFLCFTMELSTFRESGTFNPLLM